MDKGQSITVDISPAGSVNIEANGFNGCGCTEATQQIELVLGGGVAKKSSPKPEAFAPATTNQASKLSF